MWADAQHDGRPAKYRWRHTFHTAKFGWCPLLEYSAVTLLRCKTHWNLQGCPKVLDRSHPQVSRSSPYCKDVGEILLFNKFFFRIVDTCLSCEDIARQCCAPRCPDGEFLRPVFSASRVQHISDMHSKFTVRPHHVWKYGKHPVSNRWD